MLQPQKRTEEQIITDFENQTEDFGFKHLMDNIDDITPKRIVQMLGKHVIGQNAAKEDISIAVCNHLRNIKRRLDPTICNKEVNDSKKFNILLKGPTGSGKTHLLRALAKFLHLPIAVCDATSLTPYNTSTILTKLISESQEDLSLVEYGIVYIDEIDKIKSNLGGGYRSPEKEGVQQSLLKIIEGSDCEVPKRLDQSNSKTVKINTNNILFICGGAFHGIENLVKSNKPKDKVMGFGADNAHILSPPPFDYSAVTNQNLVDFGFLAEFLGRLPIKTHLNALCEKSLIDILTKSKGNLVGTYTSMFREQGNDLVISTNALKVVAKKALESNAGARDLESLMYKLLKPKIMASSDFKNKTFKITKDYAERTFKTSSST